MTREQEIIIKDIRLKLTAYAVIRGKSKIDALHEALAISFLAIQNKVGLSEKIITTLEFVPTYLDKAERDKVYRHKYYLMNKERLNKDRSLRRKKLKEAI